MRHRILALAVSLSAAGPALATPSDTKLPAMRLGYATASSGLPPATDPAPTDWARSNALVGALRGHAGHLRPRRAETPDHGATTAPAAAAGAGKP
jgi:hypothetical protein